MDMNNTCMISGMAWLAAGGLLGVTVAKHLSLFASIARRVSQTWMTTFLFVSYAVVGNLFSFRVPDLAPLGASIWAVMVFVWAQWFLNDYYDYETDRLSNPERPTISGAIERDLLRPLFLAFTLVAALPLFFIGATSLLAFGLIVAINVFYSAPPLRLKAHPLASTTCMSSYGIACGLLGFAAQGASLSPLVVKAGVVALLGGIINVSYKDLKDAQSDPASGVRTFVTRHGVDRMKRFLALTHGAAFLGAPFLFEIERVLPLTAVLGCSAVYLLLSYAPHKGSSIVYRLDFLNGCLILVCGFAIWHAQIGR